LSERAEAERTLDLSRLYSDEAGVMPVERRERVIAIDQVNCGRVTGRRKSLMINGRRQSSCDGTSRMNREVHVRFCERLGVQFPGPTRHLLGHGVRFGVVTDVVAAGEGIETMLSVRSALPDLPMVAALSANHLAAILSPVTLRRLYLVRDNDPAGDFAVAILTERARAAGIEALTLSPTLGDFNEDLRRLGVDHLRTALRLQLARKMCPDS